jgi:CRISPR-associated endonuclease Cas1
MQDGLAVCYQQTTSPNHHRRHAPMAASATVSQPVRPRNFLASASSLSWTELKPRFGVMTLAGYGIRVAVDKGHLAVEDGIGLTRRTARFSRVKHGLERLVVIGSDGFVSLGALRWLADQDASFVMLDRLGKVLLTTGPVRPSDSRLRRAQAMAHSTGAALEIARELIRHKLVGQEEVVRHRFCNSKLADRIAEICSEEVNADSIPLVRHLESQGAKLYWSAWSDLEIKFPSHDLKRVPAHWRTFGIRQSSITGSSRKAINPVNAILNYVYALLEAESRLALAALGLDPGLGVLHVDVPGRDSFACDLMESVRPLVDAYVYDRVAGDLFSRNWFFEERDGNCRLMAKFTERLSETAAKWATLVAPHAEWIVRRLAVAGAQSAVGIPHPTRLTHSNRRSSTRALISANGPEVVYPKLCATCGEPRKYGKRNCAKCSAAVSSENLKAAAHYGRIATHGPVAEARRSKTQSRQRAAIKRWQPSKQPAWLTQDMLNDRILPSLRKIEVPIIAAALRVSQPYATAIRRGTRTPHPRHWGVLAKITGTFIAS